MNARRFGDVAKLHHAILAFFPQGRAKVGLFLPKSAQ
jgi:hypothetical protein